VPARVSPTERVRAQIDELFAAGQPLAETLEQAARLSVRLVIQAALEAEVTEFLGRDRYQRDPDAAPGYRNGHLSMEVKSTVGPVVLERSKLRGTPTPFVSRLLGKGVSRTNALETLVLSGFVRGLSVRDVEAALAEALGPETALGKSTVNRICQASPTSTTPSRGVAWTPRTSGCIPTHPPSRSRPPGASPPTVRRSCWGWRPAATKAPTPGTGSRGPHRPGACAPRCW
jgi:putative transposase